MKLKFLQSKSSLHLNSEPFQPTPNPAISFKKENPMDYPALLAVLQQHANPERVVPMQAYMKHRFNYFGIGKPELARLCRPFFKDAAKQPVDWDFVRRCWDNPHRELQYAALEYLKKKCSST